MSYFLDYECIYDKDEPFSKCKNYKKFDENDLSKYYRKNEERLYIDPEKVAQNNNINSKDLTCSICYCIFNEPIKLNCEHVFCESCIKSTQNNLCPLCRTQFDIFSLNKKNKIYDIINNLQIKCERCEKSHPVNFNCEDKENIIICNFCDERITEDSVINHLEIKCDKIHSCKYCKKYIFNSDFYHESLTCPEKIIPCSGCDLKIKNSDYLEHYITCILFKKCQNCNKMIKKTLYDLHLQFECLERKINCNKCFGIVHFRDIDEHTEICKNKNKKVKKIKKSKILKINNFEYQKKKMSNINKLKKLKNIQYKISARKNHNIKCPVSRKYKRNI